MLKESEFDDILREALADYYAETPDWPGELSPKYKRKFKRMLADPVKYARRCRKKPRQKMMSYALRAAVFMLFIVSCGFLFLSDFRAIANNLFTGYYYGFNSYRFAFQVAKEEDIILPEIEIGYIPEGYELYYENINEIKTLAAWKYINADEDIITIYVSSNDVDLSKYNDDENHNYQRIFLADGRPAVLLERNDDNRSSILLWTNDEKTILFQVRGKFLKTELLNIADNITLK